MKLTKIASKGFSLVEMLVVIAIIGVIAAIAVPQIADFTEAADDSKNKRNAQNISNMAAAAQAAGLDLVKVNVIPDGVPTVANLKLIADGGEVVGGAFDEKAFGVPNMATAELTKAADYLSVVNGLLTYNPNP